MGGSQRIGAIGLRQFGIDFFQGTQVGSHRGGVTSGDRTGECRLTTPQGVLQGSTGEWADDSFGQAAGLIADGFLSQEALSGQRGTQGGHRICQQGDDVIAAVRQRRVV